MNSISPSVVDDLGKVWRKVKAGRRGVRALVIASSNPFLYCAGADIKAFTAMDAAGGETLIARDARAVPRARARRGSSRSPPSTASPSAAAASSRWPATCASPRTRRASASPRSSSASSPASAARSGCRASSAQNKALEMNLIGDPISPTRRGSTASSTASSPTTNCSTPRSPGRAGSPRQAPLAIEQIKQVSSGRRSRGRHRGREARVRDGLRQRGREGGHRGVPREARAALQGK